MTIALPKLLEALLRRELLNLYEVAHVGTVREAKRGTRGRHGVGNSGFAIVIAAAIHG